MGLYFEKEDKEILNEAVTPLQVVEYLGLPGQKIGPIYLFCVLHLTIMIILTEIVWSMTREENADALHVKEVLHRFLY